MHVDVGLHHKGGYLIGFVNVWRTFAFLQSGVASVSYIFFFSFMVRFLRGSEVSFSNLLILCGMKMNSWNHM